tara:strand:- start:787 stop:969 length:183 start_codon:yes stop_codon:yes gene_type:complete
MKNKFAFFGICVGLISSSIFYLGASNNRLSDTNEALSADVQLLIEMIEYGIEPQEPTIYW